MAALYINPPSTLMHAESEVSPNVFLMVTVYLPRSASTPSRTTRATTSGSSKTYRYFGPSFSCLPSLDQTMKGSGKALTRHSSLAALPSSSTTSFSSCSTLGGPFSRSSFRDLKRNIPVARASADRAGWGVGGVREIPWAPTDGGQKTLCCNSGWGGGGRAQCELFSWGATFLLVSWDNIVGKIRCFPALLNTYWTINIII